ncbi:TniQ family protein [Kordiimonas sp.]|uniref:TniQ family protein n=1 Tax=Kordiimonas sp. TaxID=1970157 RepID=UPI003A937C82
MITTTLGQQRLPLTVRPQASENIQGYIMRLSELNEYERPRWIYHMCDVYAQTIGYSMLKPIALRLPNLVGCSPQQIAAIGYSSSAADNHNIITVGHRGNVAAGLMEIRRPKICPQCVGEYGIAFALWDFKPYKICSRHRCRLIDQCPNPNCERQLTWWRPKLSQCLECEHSLVLDSGGEITDSVLLMFSSLLERLWGTPFSDRASNLEEPWKTASFSEVMDCIRMLTSRLTVTNGFERVNGRLSQEIHSRTIAQVFFDWPNGFFEYVNTLIELDITKGRGFSIINTTRLGSLFSRLMDGGDYPYYKHMRDALVEFLHGSKFGKHITGKGGSRLNKIPSYYKQFMTRSEVMRELGISAPTFKRVFATGQLEGDILKMGRQHVYRVTVSSVEKYKMRRF